MLKQHEARSIREQYLLKSITMADLAKKYAVTYAAIWAIIRGKTHRDAGGPIIRSTKHRDLLRLAAEYMQVRKMQTHTILQHLRRNSPYAERLPMGDLLQDLLDVKYALYNQTTTHKE